MKPIIGCIIVVGVMLGLRSVVQYAFRQTMTAATKDRVAECLTLVGNTTREVDRYTYIIGSIRNRCEMKFDQVTVSFKLDRGSSRPTLPEAVIPAYISNIQPGETKEFRSAHRIDKQTVYRFDKISAF